jgi:hypothetical protein
MASTIRLKKRVRALLTWVIRKEEEDSRGMGRDGGLGLEAGSKATRSYFTRSREVASQEREIGIGNRGIMQSIDARVYRG